MTGVADQVRSACDEAGALLAGQPEERQVREIRDTLDGPLRVAIAGRVKAGKSTLLNALVGERLAPTDAGECTRLVTVYHEALGYEVIAVNASGTSTALAFERGDRALRVDLGSSPADSIERLEVGWPSAALRQMTLIDTPGLASIDASNSRRTHAFLTPEDGGPVRADAVIYLMRHVHRSDADFLDAFLDRSVGDVSPVNAVGVLSRADEIGSCRLDAMESAARIAARLRSDSNLRSLCSSVIPVAGLLAETGQTLRESEAASLRSLASLPGDRLESLLLSVDRFCDPTIAEMPVETRRALVDRLGMFGLRLTLVELSSGRLSSGPELAALLVRVSGLAELRSLVNRHFLPRARILRSRSALSGLHTVARAVAVRDSELAKSIEARTERVAAGAHEFAELRLAHLVLTGAVRLSEEERAEIERLTADASPASRAGLAEGGDAASIRKVAMAAIERWRVRAEDPLTDPVLADVCAVAAHSYERLYQAAVS